MAKNKSSSRDARSSGIATPRVRSQVKKPSVNLATIIQDLRHLPAAPFKAPRLFSTKIAKVGPAPIIKKNFKARASHKITFTAPGQTLVCVRRKTRKQVLHALNKTGRGGQRRARHSQWSSIKC